MAVDRGHGDRGRGSGDTVRPVRPRRACTLGRVVAAASRLRARRGRRHTPAGAAKLPQPHAAGDPCDRGADLPGTAAVPHGVRARRRARAAPVVTAARSQARVQRLDVRSRGGRRRPRLPPGPRRRRPDLVAGVAGGARGRAGDRPRLRRRRHRRDQPHGGRVRRPRAARGAALGRRRRHGQRLCRTPRRHAARGPPLGPSAARGRHRAAGARLPPLHLLGPGLLADASALPLRRLDGPQR